VGRGSCEKCFNSLDLCCDSTDYGMTECRVAVLCRLVDGCILRVEKASGVSKVLVPICGTVLYEVPEGCICILFLLI